jgi:hypothetical protein
MILNRAGLLEERGDRLSVLPCQASAHLPPGRSACGRARGRRTSGR